MTIHKMLILKMFILLLAVPLASCKKLKLAGLVRDYQNTLSDSTPNDTTVTDVSATTDAEGKDAAILSAFFGLDDAMPRIADRAICEGASGKDGMPVVFSHELDLESIQAGDIKVTMASGETGSIHCVTLAPADDKGELRTLLLIGHYGTIDDQPVKVEVVGNLLSIDKTINFKGMSVTPVALEDGPSIVLAQVIPADKLDPGKVPTELPWGGGTPCPAGTKQAVNVTWNGGVTKPGGDELNDSERQKYAVTVVQADGSESKVTPFAIADLQDGDNNHKLCLDVQGTPKSVFFPAGYLTDPREDLNADTSMVITE
ncbi:MAG: hypothetical protein ACFB9M_04295 [Myxococcota bacterium]